jgi:EmrB/QacA subfamily drug resistance transporter
MPHIIQNNRRWLALIVLYIAVLMIDLDSTIVNVALPSIRADLGFSEASLVWVVNAYLLTFGGFLLLGGRLGDLYGSRTLFLIGIVAFTLASFACGSAMSRASLICARAVQGLGGAVVSAVALSLIMNLFPEQGKRAKALGVYGFVCASGGSIGVLLGGVLTSTLSWHWIFLVNVPIGIAVYSLCLYVIPATDGRHVRRRLDVTGAVAVTAALILAVYAIVNGNQAGWISKQSVGLLSAAVALLGLFLTIESRVRAPLVPLSLFRSRALLASNVVAALWSAASFAWIFFYTLYMQRVLGYTALSVAVAFLPANFVMAALSLGISARVVLRFGIKIPLATGLLLVALGLALFAGSPLNATLLADVYPGMVLIGIGGAIAFNPLLLASMRDLPSSDSGLASGLLNTAFMMGGAVGLAILASAADARTTSLLRQGEGEMLALTAGYHLAFGIGVAACLTATILGVTLIPTGRCAKLRIDEGAETTP